MWPRRGAKKPGVVTFRFGEEIPPGLPREEAERRVHQRLESEAACEVVVDGSTHDARLVNISQGGARGATRAPIEPGVQGELRVPGLLSTPFKAVTARDGDKVGLSFAAPIQLPPDLAEEVLRAA